MVALKFVKDKEQGFLLLESLITLGMITSLVLLMYPLIVNWMSIRQDAKNKVELNRIFYEYSMDWEPTQTFNKNDNRYTVQSKENSLKIKEGSQSIEVTIYEYEFE